MNFLLHLKSFLQKRILNATGSDMQPDMQKQKLPPLPTLKIVYSPIIITNTMVILWAYLTLKLDIIPSL